MQIENILLFITLLLSSCNGSKQSTVVLPQYQFEKEVIYDTEKADFHFDQNKLIAYCKQEDNREHNDFAFKDILSYIDENSGKKVVIPDTLGTKFEKESDVFFTDNDELIRVRDQNHPYAYVSEEIEWAILKFAEEAELRIFDKQSNLFVDTIIYSIVETSEYGETNIHLKNDSIIFTALRWIR